GANHASGIEFDGEAPAEIPNHAAFGKRGGIKAPEADMVRAQFGIEFPEEAAIVRVQICGYKRFSPSLHELLEHAFHVTFRRPNIANCHDSATMTPYKLAQTPKLVRVHDRDVLC